MILRLRHAVPWLQKFSGWSACTAPPPLLRRFAGTAWTAAPLAPSASEAETQSTDANEYLSSSAAADTSPEKRKRRSTRGAKAGAAAESSPPDGAGGAGEAEGTAQVATPKRRASTRRKAAAAGSEPAEARSADEPPAAPTPAKRTRQKKAAVAAAAAGEEAALAAEAADTEARRSSGAEASTSSGSSDASSTATKKRATRSTAKKVAVKASTEEGEEAKAEQRASIQSLPYEDCLVLPRKAESYLVALGLRPPLRDADAEGGASAGAAAPAAAVAAAHGGSSGSIRSVFELASYLHRPDARRLDPKDLAPPLLIAQYQGYLGPSPDYLYDLYCLDYEPPYLSSDTVRGAAVAAARAVSSAAGLLSAKGSPPEALARAAMDRLRAEVGEGAVAAQEARAPRLTEGQLELFLLDWASARLAGLKGDGGIPYLARRCAALQLTRPIILGRLHRYAVLGDSLQDLAAGASSGGGRAVRLSQPMEALIEGLKAGVRLDPERLMRDLRLTSPGSPVADHLDEIRRAVVWEAVRSLDPGGAMYYSTLVERLHVVPGIGEALRQQEKLWQAEQGERDGSVLTQAQLRLLFHLWRLERFRAEEQARLRRRKAEAELQGADAA